MDKEEGGGLFGGINKLIEDACARIVQPERKTYSPEMLGGKVKRYGPGVAFTRSDHTALNRLHMRIEYTYYKREGGGNTGRKGCVVYLHSHGGNRLEALPVLKACSETGLDFCCFDFTGSGQSDGSYTTLGIHEHEDVGPVLEDIRERFGPLEVVLWGRSMGAVCGLIHAFKQPATVSLLILDSPFSDVDQMVKDLGSSYLSVGGEMIGSLVFGLVKDAIMKKVWIDLSKFRPAVCCEHTEVPCVFVVGRVDEMVPPDRVSQMFQVYKGNVKSFMLVDGSHTSERSQEDYYKIVNKMKEILCLEKRDEDEGISRDGKRFKQHKVRIFEDEKDSGGFRRTLGKLS